MVVERHAVGAGLHEKPPVLQGALRADVVFVRHAVTDVSRIQVFATGGATMPSG